ncbi:aminoglycoside 6'-N-acetyltransferase I [Devosia sp. YR412]|uniref:aminoglycoside 6'-N-acetyltransferase n=1 Tax=Devosia sp. YR412 TaxID=1881030 RepID=UPI0008BADFE1|nr:aminoglycoside 6'-N-acetyltransferase [Devosia sp. YR412]SEQ53224.1 aminoglycoside 6'-N-acetyltransferase I [Devosia sp. YR412]
MIIAAVTPADAADWLALRNALWPGDRDDEHAEEIAQLLREPGETVTLIARDADQVAVGFAEASLRRDYVNGCETSPVAFLEGIYVIPSARRSGVARSLVAAVEDWGREQGCTEFASDAVLDNIDSHRMHHALGFMETGRVVFFRKPLS